MSMGLTCVLTDVGGACEMVVEGMNGYLVEPQNPRHIAEGWMAAFQNKDHFEREKIRTWVIEHFSLTDCVRL
jgi:glycosyltransferase involved in cell wall biosynthesis